MKDQKPAWETALEKFLLSWKNKPEVSGALACGSYITGSPSPHSDIDLHLILKSGTTWRERGNRIIDGILFEYFANPALQVLTYFQDEFNSQRRNTAHMFATGRICFDYNGEVHRLILKARRVLNKPFPAASRSEQETLKYQLWDNLDNLEEVYEAGGPDFCFAYFSHLRKALDAYTRFLCFPVLPDHKFFLLLSDPDTRRKYRVPDFPDPGFSDLYISILKLKDPSQMLDKARCLTAYILEKMGGLTIDGWKQRSSIVKN